MRSLLLTLLCLTATLLHAQNIERAKELLKANKLTEAKQLADAMATDAKYQQRSEAWYTIAKIYGAIAQDPVLGVQVPDAKRKSFESLKKYVAIDDKMLISLQIDGYKTINDIYTLYYQQAAKSFNEQAYESAFDLFRNAIEVSAYMNEKGWIKLKLDTNSVLYAGVAAEKLNQFDNAAIYYGQLVEARVQGDGFAEIYKWVANYHFEKKNTDEALKFLKIGREMYPGDSFWLSLELDMAREKGDKQALFALYEKNIAADPSNHLFLYNYSIELYQFAYNTDVTKRPSNSATLIEKTAGLVKKLTTLKPDYSRGQLFAGQVYYNMGVDELKKSKAISGTSPEDVKTKAGYKAAALAKFELAIPYLTESARLLEQKSKLTAGDKSDLKEAYDLLITAYDQKKDPEKVKEYEVKFNEVGKRQ